MSCIWSICLNPECGVISPKECEACPICGAEVVIEHDKII